ncbi:hypothetical protein [Streptomyces sp. NPDC058486]|uniref:hypothetical protein n=1 Tax=unclassified Streptomyces TaxID=2593676 RepID=UPI003664DA09
MAFIARFRRRAKGPSFVFSEPIGPESLEVRKNAIAQGDETTVAYVKTMYSKFVSTIGEFKREPRHPPPRLGYGPEDCPRRTFAKTLFRMAAPHARFTTRLNHALERVGLAPAGRAGAQLGFGGG